MAKKYLGIDIGYDSMKLALVKRGKVLKSAVVPMPVKLLREGRITSAETMGELLRDAMKQHKIRAGLAAVVLSGEVCYLRSATMPLMTAEQLAINVPYEFRDYITEELKQYVFDYAVVSVPEREKKQKEASETLSPEGVTETLPGTGFEGDDYGGESPQGETGENMELLMAACPVTLLEELRDALRRAGLKLAKAAPPECAFIALIRSLEARRAADSAVSEYCILDLGFQAIRMYIFRGDRYVVTRVLELGLSSLDDVIAEAMGVDSHLAHTYLLTNFEGCQTAEYCRAAYGNISVELMRALNFYRFSNPDSTISNVWICGGGAGIAPLRDAIAETLSLEIHTAEEFLPGMTEPEDCSALLQAAGITMD